VSDQGGAFCPCDGPRLFQGEILSELIERRPRWRGKLPDGEDDMGFDGVHHPYAVVLTQDCDLEQDARERELPPDQRKRPGALLEHVLLVLADAWDRQRSTLAGSDIAKQARQNKIERYQYLSAVPTDRDALGQGVPALLLDLKRVFTVPLGELLGAIERKETFRRARLITPYAEHLASRYGYFAMRVPLPVDHHNLG